MNTNSILIFFVIVCQVWAAQKNKHQHVKSELYLSSYIESGKISEGRKLSEVNLPEIGTQLKSYSGYLTINKTNNANSFFWFFPAKVSFKTYKT